MTDNNHPITPPPELVKQWWDGTHGAFYEFEAVVTQAACWGADQELDACCAWLTTTAMTKPWDTVAQLAFELRNARRPKPPSLKELNLKHLEVMERDGHYLPEIIADLRRAIESLPS